MTQYGNPIAQTGAKPVPPPGPPPKPTGVYEHPQGERLQTRWFHLNIPPEHRKPPEAGPFTRKNSCSD